jgi:hypothetical protein
MAIVPSAGRIGSFDYRTHHCSKARSIWRAMQHDFRQSLGCVQGYVTSLSRRLGRIQAPRIQFSRQPIPVFLGRDDHGGIASSERGTNKSAQFIEEETIFSVELNYVRGLSVVGPLRDWREGRGVQGQSIDNTHTDPVPRHSTTPSTLLKDEIETMKSAPMNFRDSMAVIRCSDIQGMLYVLPGISADESLILRISRYRNCHRPTKFQFPSPLRLMRGGRLIADSPK